MAHMLAEANQGSVVIHRCMNDETANRKVQELLNHITIAVGYGVQLPLHQEIWYYGFHLSPMVQDELTWFAAQPEHFVYANPRSGVFTYFHQRSRLPILNTRSSGNFMSSVDSANFEYEDNSIALLYNMLDDDEFEHLMAHLIKQHPDAEDVTTEDYVLNLFVEHAKKVKNG